MSATAGGEAAVRARTRDYLRANGTEVAAGVIRRRVAQAFDNLEKFLAPFDAPRAAQGARPGEWSLHEIADHVVETHRPSLEELRALLAGHRPAHGPVPASLQSPAPLARPWPALLAEMRAVHAGIVGVLDAAPADVVTEARAPVVMVVNGDDGRPLHWVEELDWKAYAIVLRLHAIDHLHQARKVAAALSP